jgi:hypothetical protein
MYQKGQTGRSFKTQYEEHISNIRHSKENSKYALHMSQSSHEYGTIENTLDVLKLVKKGKLLDVVERFYIYKAIRKKKTDQNVLFEMLLKSSKCDNKRCLV